MLSAYRSIDSFLISQEGEPRVVFHNVSEFKVQRAHQIPLTVGEKWCLGIRYGTYVLSANGARTHEWAESVVLVSRGRVGSPWEAESFAEEGYNFFSNENYDDVWEDCVSQ